jgi:hypothetical protein
MNVVIKFKNIDPQVFDLAIRHKNDLFISWLIESFLSFGKCNVISLGYIYKMEIPPETKRWALEKLDEYSTQKDFEWTKNVSYEGDCEGIKEYV